MAGTFLKFISRNSVRLTKNLPLVAADERIIVNYQGARNRLLPTAHNARRPR